jgi:hypothetical protein
MQTNNIFFEPSSSKAATQASSAAALKQPAKQQLGEYGVDCFAIIIRNFV